MAFPRLLRFPSGSFSGLLRRQPGLRQGRDLGQRTSKLVVIDDGGLGFGDRMDARQGEMSQLAGQDTDQVAGEDCPSFGTGFEVGVGVGGDGVGLTDSRAGGAYRVLRLSQVRLSRVDRVS